MTRHTRGISAALLSALFLGVTPVFGKQAILLGLPWQAVVSARTLLAVALLALILFIFRRQYFYIYPAGLLGCFLAGGINGFGSLLFYGALSRIDAGLGQLLYSLYPLFLAIYLRLDRQPLSRLTLARLAMTVPALFLLTQAGGRSLDLTGVVMMLGAAMLYALHLPINQRVLYDMPAPTVTFYTLISMSAVVAPAYILSRLVSAQPLWLNPFPQPAVLPLLLLTLATFLSRLTLFMGVKHLGDMQTALLGLGELVITVVLAHLLLNERFSGFQWVGLTLLVASLGLVGIEPPSRKPSTSAWLNWLRPPGLPKDFPWPPTN
jgi:drug/metabolite transporter (DMT)-like permease